MSRSNCVFYVLDRIHEVGGYIQARLSDHWTNLHARHIDRAGVMSHYVPPKDLDSAWQSLGMFDGHILNHDPVAANPAPVRAILFGVTCLFVLTLAWAMRKATCRALRAIRPTRTSETTE